MTDKFDEWMEQYRPIPNPTGDSGFAANDVSYMYETYGEELAAVKEAYRKNPATVWTITDGDDGEWYLGDGFHFVNRVGYFITELAYEGDPVCIKID